MNLSRAQVKTFSEAYELSKTAFIAVNAKTLTIESINFQAKNLLDLQDDKIITGQSCLSLLDNPGFQFRLNKQGKLIFKKSILPCDYTCVWEKRAVNVENEKWLFFIVNHERLNDRRNALSFGKKENIGMLNDNSERTRIYLKNIIENLPQYVYWKDENRLYQGGNRHVLELLNLNSQADLIGKSDNDFGWSKARVKSIQDIDKLIIEKGICNVVEDPVPVRGTTKILLTSKTPLRDDNGRVIGILGISTDITEQKQWSEQLRIAKEKAEAANEAKSDFISNMEHDLRTPFAGIGGVADLLYSVYSSKYPDLKELFEIMTQSCTQWQEVHNRIFDALDVQQTLKIECFYVQDEMEKMKDLMGATSKMKQIKFNLSYPSREKTGPIETDLLKFKLILSSLVGNAINFTKVGSVTLKLKYNQTNFILNIIDTGIGIAQEKLESIFEKFTKLSRSNTYGEKFQGMGLGLYNARRDAEKIQACISVKSELGQGSTFTLRLPTKIKCT